MKLRRAKIKAEKLERLWKLFQTGRLKLDRTSQKKINLFEETHLRLENDSTNKLFIRLST